MYESFYGLDRKPFTLLPDADFFYLGPQHRRAAAMLEYGMAAEAGFVAITGEVGTGKTSLIRRFLRTAGEQVTLGVITNANKAFGRPLAWAAAAFALDTIGDYPALYQRFVDFLVAQYGEGRRTVLVIDEAQNLEPDTLEEIRLLSNVNNERDQILQIVLVGQPELLATLRRPELRQLVQRISVHHHLAPLGEADTPAYIGHRLIVAGGDPGLFEEESCAAVHYFTAGVPRLVNLLCDLALVYGFSDDRPRIGADLVIDAVRDRARGGLSAFAPLPDEGNPRPWRSATPARLAAE